MPAVNIADLNNAKADVEHLARIANSPLPTSTSRTGEVVPTMAGLAAMYPNAYGVQDWGLITTPTNGSDDYGTLT